MKILFKILALVFGLISSGTMAVIATSSFYSNENNFSFVENETGNFKISKPGYTFTINNDKEIMVQFQFKIFYEGQLEEIDEIYKSMGRIWINFSPKLPNENISNYNLILEKDIESISENNSVMTIVYYPFNNDGIVTGEDYLIRVQWEEEGVVYSSDANEFKIPNSSFYYDGDEQIYIGYREAILKFNFSILKKDYDSINKEISLDDPKNIIDYFFESIVFKWNNEFSNENGSINLLDSILSSEDKNAEVYMSTFIEDPNDNSLMKLFFEVEVKDLKPESEYNAILEIKYNDNNVSYGTMIQFEEMKFSTRDEKYSALILKWNNIYWPGIPGIEDDNLESSWFFDESFEDSYFHEGRLSFRIIEPNDEYTLYSNSEYSDSNGLIPDELNIEENIDYIEITLNQNNEKSWSAKIEKLDDVPVNLTKIIPGEKYEFTAELVLKDTAVIKETEIINGKFNSPIKPPKNIDSIVSINDYQVDEYTVSHHQENIKISNEFESNNKIIDIKDITKINWQIFEFDESLEKIPVLTGEENNFEEMSINIDTSTNNNSSFLIANKEYYLELGIEQKDYSQLYSTPISFWTDKNIAAPFDSEKKIVTFGEQNINEIENVISTTMNINYSAEPKDQHWNNVEKIVIDGKIIETGESIKTIDVLVEDGEDNKGINIPNLLPDKEYEFTVNITISDDTFMPPPNIDSNMSINGQTITLTEILLDTEPLGSPDIIDKGELESNVFYKYNPYDITGTSRDISISISKLKISNADNIKSIVLTLKPENETDGYIGEATIKEKEIKDNTNGNRELIINYQIFLQNKSKNKINYSSEYSLKLKIYTIDGTGASECEIPFEDLLRVETLIAYSYFGEEPKLIPSNEHNEIIIKFYLKEYDNATYIKYTYKTSNGEVFYVTTTDIKSVNEKKLKLSKNNTFSYLKIEVFGKDRQDKDKNVLYSIWETYI